jgi:threonyl-tRNA synthetase
MIHHAIFGSLGRMIAILLEHHGGVLPFWLSPDQVAVAPISKDQAGYGADVLAAFEDAGIRAVAYDGADTPSRRIVTAHEMAVPMMAIVGEREMRDGRVSLRERDGSQADVPLAEAVSRLQARARPGALAIAMLSEERKVTAGTLSPHQPIRRTITASEINQWIGEEE